MRLLYLGQPLLVGQGGDVRPETLEGVVDALHAAALSEVGGLTLLNLLLRTLVSPSRSQVTCNRGRRH